MTARIPPSWPPLGAVFGASRAVLGAFGAVYGPSWGALWGRLGTVSVWDCLGASESRKGEKAKN
eukprot:7769354-Pyramimonas_sp.AAC.1